MTSVEASERRRAFCARLKSEREHRGRSLADIAGSTKIKASLLTALERGDLSRWPKGIYRRSFFRDYVAAIGLPPEPYVNEFLDVFAEAPPPPTTAVAPSEPVSFRMMFASDVRLTAGSSPIARGLKREARLVAAVVDVLLVAAVARAITAVAPVPFALSGASVGALAYVLFAWLNASPGAWLLRRRQHATGAAPVTTFAPSSLPYNAYRPGAVGGGVSTRTSFVPRLREMVASSMERLSDTKTLLFNGRRRRDLASVRRRRVEAANSTADEFSVT
jgi:hypothetical protein